MRADRHHYGFELLVLLLGLGVLLTNEAVERLLLFRHFHIFFNTVLYDVCLIGPKQERENNLMENRIVFLV